MAPLTIERGKPKELAKLIVREFSESTSQSLARIAAYGADLGIPTKAEIDALNAVHEEALVEDDARWLADLAIFAA